MKIVYLIAGTYRAAGMERVLANKANWLAGRGNEILIVTTEQKGRPSAFGFAPSIRFQDLGIGYEDNNGGSFFSKLMTYPLKQFRHRKKLSELLKKERPDITVSMFCNDASFVPGIKDGSKKVLEVHFSRFKRLQYQRQGLWALADRLRCRQDRAIASRFDRFVVLTNEDAGYWGQMPNLSVIPNARTFTFDAPSALDSGQVIAAGRFSHQKGFDLLLKAWKLADTEGWTLRLAGEGDMSMLGSEIPANVKVGPSGDIRKEYLESSIYALSSRYEGLPMVLLEAQAAGLPCVCFKCKCGPMDIIEDGKSGLLVEEGDIDGFAAALERLMKDADLRKRMGAEALKNSDDYDEERIMELWEKLFGEL